MSEESLQLIFSKSQQQIEYLGKLLEYGRTKGFQNFINRKLIWPFLLGLDPHNLSESIYEWDGEMDRNSVDYQQLQKDAERSLASMKTFQNITKFHLQKRQRDVLKILDSFFAKHQQLRYIQGFHDVASIFLVLFGNSNGYYMMEKAGKTYFRDFLTKDIGTLGMLISEMVLDLLVQKDEEFKNIFECFSQSKMLIFIVPWVLTWFSHVFSSVKIICRIWDYILCTGPQGIIYLTAGIILATKDQLISKCSDEYDQASIHVFYQEKAKSQSIDIQRAIFEALQLQKTVSLSSLNVFQSLDPASIFLPQNFQLQIDLHRRVQEYHKLQAIKAATKKKVAAAASFLFLAATGAVWWYLKQRKIGL